MYQNFNVLTYFHPGNNGQSVFHRYHDPVDHHLIQGDFDGLLSINRQDRGISSVQTNPKKNLGTNFDTFSLSDFQEKLIGLLSSENGFVKGYRYSGGGSPPLLSAAK